MGNGRSEREGEHRSWRRLHAALLLLVVLFCVCASSVSIEEANRARAAYIAKHNCTLDEMFFPSTTSPNGDGEACGQCVPGTTGQWRVVGAPADGKVRTRYCPAPLPGYERPECEGRDAVRHPSGYHCGINEYCTDAGLCRALTSSPRYGTECHGGGSANTTECGVGLHCIFHRCVICEEGTSVDLSLHRRFGTRVMQGVCINGEYLIAGSWRLFTTEPDSVFLFVIFVSSCAVALVFLVQWLVREVFHRCYYSVRLRTFILQHLTKRKT